MTTTVITTLDEQIKDLICTSKPYYALQNLQALTDTLVQCEIEVENFNYGEATPISAAETGRHLAILGSAALAYTNPLTTKHYYLAVEAYLDRSKEFTPLAEMIKGGATRLIGRAEVISLDAKTAKVHTSIATWDGRTIYDLEVSYKVMKADLFQKLFRNKYVDDMSFKNTNPYTQNIPIQNLTYHAGVLTGGLGVIEPKNCVGHFDHYPALPIAILSSAFMDMADKHLKHLTKNDNVKYAPTHCKLSAARLAFAGEEVFMKSTFIDYAAGEYAFKVVAVNELLQELGEVELIFEVIE